MGTRLAKSRAVRAFIGLALLAAMLSFSDPASAVHDSGAIELDTGTNGADLVDSASGSDPRDWADVFSSSGVWTPATDPAGTIDASFDQDFVPGASGPDNSYFEPSTKDDQSISSTGGASVWGCTTASNPTDKNDILNSYSAAVVAGSGTDAGDTILYTGGERYANDGSAFWGIWYFQANNTCDASAGNAKFTSTKTDGDVLLLVNFDNGGANITIDAFKWHPCNATGTPIAPSKCKDPAVAAGFFTPALSGTVGGDCAAAAAADDVCATVNRANVTTPWPTKDKTSAVNTLAVSEFFEAGFNITDALAGGTQGTEPCFSSFLLETRSSSSIDATLKDFSGGNLQTCGSVTAHKYHDTNADGDDDGASDPALSGWTMFIDKDNDGVKDTGEVSGVTDASGNVTFSNIKAGSIKVCEVLTATWINSDPGLGTPGTPATGTALCQTVNVTVGGSTTIDFGNYQPGSISGTKFQDADGDGVQDAGEAALAGVYIHLFGTTGYGTAVHSHTQTSATGTYSFTNLQPGSYTLCETIPTGYTQTWPTSGPSCSTHTGHATPPGDASGFGISVTLGSNGNSLNNNFGNVSLHKVIVIVCHEGTNTLVSSSVTFDGTTGSSVFNGDNTLCGLPTVGTGKTHGSYSATVAIPSSGTGSGH
jgi:hypothetical protein